MNSNKKQNRIKRKEQELEFESTYVATIIASLTLVAGLFWQDAIQELIEFIPQVSNLFGKFVVALVITAIFVFIINNLNRKVKKDRKNLEREKNELMEDEKK